VLDDFDAHKAISEAQERHEHAAEMHAGAAAEKRHGRYVPLLAALFAVIAAIASLLSNKSATEALMLKNEAIFVRTEAADSYNFYQAKSIKQHVYEAALDANPALAASPRQKLASIAAREKREKAPLLERARAQEERAKALGERSEHFSRAHEIMEGGVTLLEVSIAIVSIAALTSSTFLIGTGAFAAASGLAILVYGITRP